MLGNHVSVFLSSGFKECRPYRYYSDEKRGIDIEGLLEDLRNAPENSVVILQCCGHNPTGCDLVREEWIQIADVIEVFKRNYTYFIYLYYFVSKIININTSVVNLYPVRYDVRISS